MKRKIPTFNCPPRKPSGLSIRLIVEMDLSLCLRSGTDTVKTGRAVSMVKQEEVEKEIVQSVGERV
jgi:hypothetical protein